MPFDAGSIPAGRTGTGPAMTAVRFFHAPALEGDCDGIDYTYPQYGPRLRNSG